MVDEIFVRKYVISLIQFVQMSSLYNIHFVGSLMCIHVIMKVTVLILLPKVICCDVMFPKIFTVEHTMYASVYI